MKNYAKINILLVLLLNNNIFIKLLTMEGAINNVYIYLRIVKLLTLFISEGFRFLYIKIGDSIYGRQTNRLELIQRICKKLERENIVYVKIFQALCLAKNILDSEEQDFLLKYTDNVPYSISDIDYNMLDKLTQDYSITLNSTKPINSGIVGLVFDGYDSSNNKVIVKMLKKNIANRFKYVFDELLFISYVCDIIPYIKSLRIRKILLDNRAVLLDQMNLTKELEYIEIFTKKFKNNKEYRFPRVYREITEKNDKLLVMENISGLRFKDIQNMSDTVKEEFAYIIYKFGILGMLYHSIVHCDMHCGNIFFYINNDNDVSCDTLTPKYTIGIIDFGICTTLSKENQNTYYILINAANTKQDYPTIEKLLTNITEEKKLLNSFEHNKKHQLFTDVIELFESNKKHDITYKLFTELSSLFYKYDLNFTEEFNRVCLSVNSSYTLIKQLSYCVKETISKVLKDLNKCNDLIYIA